MISRVRKTSFIFLVFMSYFINLMAQNCEQKVTVKYTPYPGVKVYTVSGGSTGNVTQGNDKRGVVDLGHFNGAAGQKKLNIGTVEVTVEMVQSSSTSTGKNEFEIVDTSKLELYNWNYKYHVTSFIGKDSANANVILDRFIFLEKIGADSSGVMEFNCNGTNHSLHPKLKYQFDLILELIGLPEGGMYGFSFQKNESDGAYVNIKDIVVDQLKGQI